MLLSSLKLKMKSNLILLTISWSFRNEPPEIKEGFLRRQITRDDLPTFDGDFEDLFAVFLSARFCVPFDKRYIFDGITVRSTDDVVRFVSDEIRHQVMHAYAVKKLLTNDDMKNFIKVASVDCLLEYGRPWLYTRKKGESCLFIPEDMEKFYFEKLGYVAIKHMLFCDESLKSTTWKQISKMNDIPFDLCIQSKDFRERFVEYVDRERTKQGDELHSLKYTYSAFLFNNKKQLKENIEESTWPILLTILMSDGYQIKNSIATIPRTIRRFLNIGADQFREALKQIKIKVAVFKTNEEHVTFASTEIKHAVMYRFVYSCLKTDEDLETYIEQSSTDSLMEYCRLWDYKRDEEETCVFISPKFRDAFIKRLDRNVIIHAMIEDRADSDEQSSYVDTRNEISELLHIPLEVLFWDIDRRRRYVDTIKHGTKKMYRARGMLVGCTGAGKTSLLMRLQGKDTAEIQYPPETTLGLDIHENVIEIECDTFGDYFTFWLQCIQTYCEDGGRGRVGNNTETVNRRNPVILIASHKDKAKSKTYATELAFFETLKRCLPQEQALKNLLSPDRYYEVECPPGRLTNQQMKMIEDVKECVIQTARRLPHWGEEIPFSWTVFEGTLKQKKKERILKKSTLQQLDGLRFTEEYGMDDMLQFFHEIGQIIYFADEKLRDTIIIDVQWFVDGFKNIITDPKHLARQIQDLDNMKQRGRIEIATLKEIWEKAEDNSYIEKMNDIVPYMEKLGLMVEMKTKNGQNTDGEFYIPSMNRIDISPREIREITIGQTTSILIFHFKTYLPHFFFFRLVVHCFQKWDALDQKMFGKNIAFYKNNDTYHCIAVAVNKTSIQLQVFTQRENMKIQPERVLEIRDTVENIVSEITETFHSRVKYDIGYSCNDIQITCEDEEFFLTEDEVLKVDKNSSCKPCPKHVSKNKLHDIGTDNLLRFWRRDVKST